VAETVLKFVLAERPSDKWVDHEQPPTIREVCDERMRTPGDAAQHLYARTIGPDEVPYDGLLLGRHVGVAAGELDHFRGLIFVAGVPRVGDADRRPLARAGDVGFLADGDVNEVGHGRSITPLRDYSGLRRG